MQQLADALRLAWAPLVQFEPTSPVPWIELNDEDLQIQVSVNEQSVSITIPYFRQRTTEMMECVRSCLTVCQEHSGYTAYDPQLGRAVTAQDTDDIAHVYRDMDKELPGMLGTALPKKPWWKFW